MTHTLGADSFVDLICIKDLFKRMPEYNPVPLRFKQDRLEHLIAWWWPKGDGSTAESWGLEEDQKSVHWKQPYDGFLGSFVVSRWVLSSRHLVGLTRQ